MSDSTTRIADLPENPMAGQNSLAQLTNNGLAQPINNGLAQLTNNGLVPPNFTMEMNAQNAYIPMNIHPNPYGQGSGGPNNVMPPPLQTSSPPMQQMAPMYMPANNVPSTLTPEQQMMLQNMKQNPLPSRDIHIETSSFAQDEEIQANYIPKSKKQEDFVRDYENLTETKLEKHEQGKHRERLVDRIFTEIQLPLLISILYFVFQMPIVNKLFFKPLSFLTIYGADGNFNFQGLILRSLLFGLCFHTMVKLALFLSEL
jgi:hypothetical protein